MSSDNFLSNRKSFAERIGHPELYDLIDHYSLYAGIHTLGNKLWTFEMLKATTNIPGDVAEFGCWKGSNLMFLAKMLTLLEPSSSKRVFGFDNFSGLPESVHEDGAFAASQVGKYCGNEAVLREAITLFELNERVELIVGDALETVPKFHEENPHSVLSFAYIDFDLYEPTKCALAYIDDAISVGGIIVFDEACTKEWPGETLAMKEFLGKTDKKFEMISNSFSLQPTVALKRVG